MKVFEKQYKAGTNSQWGYWGNYGEIELGISSGLVQSLENFLPDKLHYHKRGIIFLVGLTGEGILEIDGQEVPLKKDLVVRIDPGEKYYHKTVTMFPFQWITICTVKDIDDKVLVK
jgi:mannose-6-phosphate isomerase-like protein (cupin superfamily)